MDMDMDTNTAIAVWKEFGPELIKLAKNYWELFNWEIAYEKYCKHLEAEYSETRLFGKNNPVAIEGIYTDVFLSDQPDSYIRNLTERINKHKQLNALSMIREKKFLKIALLGKPGAGKSTFLKYLVIKTINDKDCKQIPVYISIKNWSDSEKNLFSYIEEEFKDCSFPNPKQFIECGLSEGKFLFLFDGLDEVRNENRKRDLISSDVDNFCKKYNNNQFVITCRPAASEYLFANFAYFQLCDFNEAQVRNFSEKWFNNEDKSEEFLQYLDRYRQIKELSNTPLLLSLLCLYFDSTNLFPENHVELFDEAIKILLYRWDNQRNVIRDRVYQDLSLKRKIQLLSEIADDTFRLNKTLIKENELSAIVEKNLRRLPNYTDSISSGDVIKSIESQHGLIVEAAANYYAFSHLTLQEYFVANYILDASTRSIKDLINNHSFDTRWREVFLNIASMLSSGDHFFDQLSEHIRNYLNRESSHELQILIKWVLEKAENEVDELDIFQRKIIYLFIAIVNIEIEHETEILHKDSLTHRRMRVLDIIIDIIQSLRPKLLRTSYGYAIKANKSFVADCEKLLSISISDFSYDGARDGTVKLHEDIRIGTRKISSDINEKAFRSKINTCLAFNIANLISRVVKVDNFSDNHMQAFKQYLIAMRDKNNKELDTNNDFGTCIKNILKQNGKENFIKEIRNTLENHFGVISKWKITEDDLNHLENYIYIYM